MGDLTKPGWAYNPIYNLNLTSHNLQPMALRVMTCNHGIKDNDLQPMASRKAIKLVIKLAIKLATL